MQTLVWIFLFVFYLFSSWFLNEKNKLKNFINFLLFTDQKKVYRCLMRVELQFYGSFLDTCKMFLIFSGESIRDWSKFNWNCFFLFNLLDKTNWFFWKFYFKRFLLNFSNKTNYCRNFARKRLFVEIFQQSKCFWKL